MSDPITVEEEEMTSISVRVDEPFNGSMHVLVHVFAGDIEGQRAHLGTLHCRHEEADLIVSRLLNETAAMAESDVA